MFLFCSFIGVFYHANIASRNKLKKFLVLAKRNTYAGLDDEATIQSTLLPQSMQLEFQKGKWMYRDIYQGMSFFTGMETVYYEDKPVWAMSYSGGILPEVDTIKTTKAYEFLRSALMLVPEQLPIRGPLEYSLDEFVYGMKLEGSLDRFFGGEEIHFMDDCIFKLSFAGGNIN